MTRNNLNARTNHSLMSTKIKYKDLAIAIALSGASLLLVPAVAKADTTSPATSTSSTTPTAVATSTPSSSTATTAPAATTAPSAGTSTSGAQPAATGTSSTAAPASSSTTSSTTSTPATSTTPVTPPASTTTTSTTPAATEYTIYAQAVDLSGKALGSPVAVGTSAANTSATVDWTPTAILTFEDSIPDSSNYVKWNATDLDGDQTVPVDSSDVTLSIPFALKTVTTTYTFVDETTGKTIDTETNTWDLTSTSGEEAFKTYGLRAPMALYTLTNSTPVLEASDDSTTPVTDTADLPYFGPDGDIFDNGYYVLDTSKSAGTPLDYSTWPTSGTIDETFYYKEATEPSVTVEAVDPSGKVLKTFSTTSFGAALPSTTVTAAADLPTAEALDLPGYTLTGVTVSGSASHSGIPDKTLTYTGTPADYSAFLTSTQGSGTYDIRQLMNDYNDATVAFQYTPNVVKLMVQPVDAQGNPIGSPIEVASGTVGSSESIKLPAVTGYEAATGFDTNITISPDQGVISVPYTKVTTEPTNPTEGNGGSGTTTPGTGSSSGSTTGSASETSTTKPGTTASSTSTSGKAPAYATRESYKAAKASLKKTASPSSLKSSGLLSGTSATGSKFPQTGNDNSMTVLSAIGLALMGTLGLCYKKIKRLL